MLPADGTRAALKMRGFDTPALAALRSDYTTFAKVATAAFGPKQT